MTRPMHRIGLIALVAFVLAGSVVTTKNVQEYRFRPYLHDNLYLPSGKFIQQASLGYREIVADIVWFNAVQYYGGYRKDYHDLAYFEGLIDIVTELDPHFIFPYIFAGVVLSQDMGSYDGAVEVLKKGMAKNPKSWQLPFEIGFLSYVDARDSDTAARYFDLASRLPGGGDRAKRFAAFVYKRAGHEEMSVKMWQQLFEETDDPYMRDLAAHYIRKLQVDGKEGSDADI